MACSLGSDKIYLKYIQDYIGIMINDAEGIWRPEKACPFLALIRNASTLGFISIKLG